MAEEEDDIEVLDICFGAQPVVPIMTAKAKRDQSIPVTLHREHRAIGSEPFI